jgi:integrase
LTCYGATALVWPRSGSQSAGLAGIRLDRSERRGTPLDPDNVLHWFSRICQRAGVGHWHPHELRHSGALMLAQYTDLYVVSEVLGHSSVAITKDVYGHLVEGQKRSAAARMSEALLTSMAPAMAPRARPHQTRMLAEREKEGFDKTR